MVYDEGFELRFDNHKTFFGYFKYVTQQFKVANDKDDEQTEGYESICSETYMGWVFD